MNSKWKSCRFGDILTLQRGFDITKKEQKQGSVPVVSSSGINSYHNTAKVKGPGVIIGRKGTLGTFFYVEKDYWPHDTTLWIKDFHGNLPKFTYYFLSTLNLANFDVGASNPTLNRNHVHLLPIHWPPIITQHKIAAILSAYDDLIENNTRRIAILEEMAQTIYREWFVHFRYPGHEKNKMTELESIPEGWSVKTLKDFGVVVTGKTPSKLLDEYFNETYMPFIKTPDLHGNIFCIQTNEHLSEKGVLTQKNKTVPPNSICVSCIGTPGVVSITTEYSQTNQQINSIILSDQQSREFLYFAINFLKETISLYGSNGATMINLNKNKFELLEINYPGKNLIKEFHDKTYSIFEQIKWLQITNINLCHTRDLLLPKLISGEIDVEELDIAIPDIAEPEDTPPMVPPEPIDAKQLALLF